MLSTLSIYFILIFLTLTALIVAYRLWKWLPVFVIIGNIVWVITFYLLFGDTQTGTLSVILFIFGIPSFSVIAVYYFIYWAFFKPAVKKVVVELPAIYIQKR